MKDSLYRLLQIKLITSVMIFILFLIIYYSAILIFIGLDSPVHVDERHFYQNILLFHDQPEFATIQDYEEVTPPLFYTFYAIAAKVVGTSLESLRMFNLFLSLISYSLLFYIFHKVTINSLYTLLATIFILINPYIIGISIYLYTDLLSFLLLLITIYALYQENGILYLVGSTLGILTRQYFVFLPLAAGLFYMLKYIIGQDRKKALSFIAYSFLSTVPVIILFFIWGGLAPKSGLAKWNPVRESLYEINHITVYITTLAVYAFPFILNIYNKIGNRAFFIAGLVISPVYFLFPVKVSESSAYLGEETIGFLHKAVRMALTNDNLEQYIFYVLFAFSLISLFFIIPRLYKAFQNKNLQYRELLILSLLIFLLLMPFSYQVWEKYLINIIPITGLLSYLINPWKKVDQIKD